MLSYIDTPLGLLPNEWAVVKLEDILLYKKASINPQSFPDEEFEYYSIPAFAEYGKPVFEIGKAIHSQKLLVEKGSVLFGKLNPRVPKIWYVTSDAERRKIASTEFIPLKNRERVSDEKYIYYLAWSEFVLPRSQELVSGSTPSRQRVDVSAFLKIPIPLPPLPEQRAIAHVLNTMRQSIEATERVIVAARELKRSLMKYLFTYGPVPVGQADQVKLKETEFGEVPFSWDILPLDNCAYVQTGTAKGRKFGSENTVTKPYLRVANVQDGFLDLSEIKNIIIKESEVQRFQLQSGDVLMTEGGDFDKLGRGFIWKGEIPGCIHQNHIFAVRVHQDKISPEYFAYLIQSNYGKAYFLKVAHRTTHLASINSTKLKALPVPLPTLEEQNTIINSLKKTDIKIYSETQHKSALETLFQSLLHHLMTGKLRVKDLPLEGLPG